MRYYFPIEDENGQWHVAYLNHRNQPNAVLGGLSQLQAIEEARAMTLNAFKQAA